MKKTLPAFIFCLLFLMIPFGNVRPSVTSDGSDQVRQTGDVVLTLMMWGWPEEKQAVYKILKSFQEIHTNIGIKVLFADSLSYMDKLQSLFAGGNPPDVFYVNGEDLCRLASKGLLYPLDGFTNEQDLDIGDFFPEILDMYKYDNRLYAVPKSWTSFVLYYNKNLFDGAGLRYPDANWTWDDFLNAAKKLTKDVNGDNVIDRYGFIVEGWSTWYYNWIIQNGGGVFDENGNWAFSSVEYFNKNAEAIQFLADLMNVFKVAPDPTSARQLGSYDSFIAGRLGMCMYGRWAMYRFKTIKNFKWDYAVLPYKSQRASTVVSVAYSMAGNAQHPAEAWELLKYLTRGESMIYDAESGLAVPARRSITGSDHYLKAPEVIKFQPQLARNSMADDPFVRQLSYACYLPSNAKWQEIRRAMDEQLEDAFFGNKDAKTEIIALDPIVAGIMNDDQGPHEGPGE